MLDDEKRARLHQAICVYPSLTAMELADKARTTIREAMDYKREQKLKILAAAKLDEGMSESFNIKRL